MDQKSVYIFKHCTILPVSRLYLRIYAIQHMRISGCADGRGQRRNVSLDFTFAGCPRLRAAETHPSVGLRQRLARAVRGCKHLPSSGPRSAPAARQPLATARHRRPGASRGCGVGNADSLPWEARAGGTAAKRPRISISVAAASHRGWRRSNPGPHGSPARTAAGIHLAFSMGCQGDERGLRYFHVPWLRLGQQPSNDGTTILNIRPPQREDLASARTRGAQSSRKVAMRHGERERRHLRSPESAAKEDGQNRAIT